MKNTKNATKVSSMKKQLEGEKQRRHLMFCLEDHPGLTAYEISKKLNWTRGKVHYHLKILYNEGEIRWRTREGKIQPQKVYYVVPWEEMVKRDDSNATF